MRLFLENIGKSILLYRKLAPEMFTETKKKQLSFKKQALNVNIRRNAVPACNYMFKVNNRNTRTRC